MSGAENKPNMANVVVQPEKVQQKQAKEALDFSISGLSHISENKSMVEFKKLKKKTEATTRIEDSQLQEPCRPKSGDRKDRKLHGNKINATTISPKNDLKGNLAEKFIQQKPVISHKIDTLIHKNIRRNKEKKEVEELKKFEYEERIRLNKVILSERNKVIREMNAKSFSKSRVFPAETTVKQAWSAVKRKFASSHVKKTEVVKAVSAVSALKPPSTETERRAKLGLVFLDLQNKYFGGTKTAPVEDKVIKVNKSSKPMIDPEKALEIREYMERKKERIQAERQKKKKAEQGRKAKINQNVAKLREMITKIFTESQRSKTLTAKLKESTLHKPKSDRQPKKRQETPDYIHYLIPAAANKVQKPTINTDDDDDPQLMDNIRVELLNEISSGRTPTEGAAVESTKKMETVSVEKEVFQNQSIIKANSALKIQKVFKGYLVRKALKGKVSMSSPFDEPNLRKMLQGSASKSQNEKVVHLSRINTIEDIKEENGVKPSSTKAQTKATATVETQTEQPIETAEIQIQTSVLGAKEDLLPKVMPFEVAQPEPQEPASPPQDLPKSSSLTEMRLLLGSEKLVKDNSAQKLLSSPGDKSASFYKNEPSQKRSLELNDELMDFIIENQDLNAAHSSLFNRNTFQDFTLKKLKELLKVDNVSKLIGMREKVLKYKESTEKRYIQKMYKAKKLSPKTYQSKRKELEKWVTKEQEEIKKSKTSLVDTWKRTAVMIEEAQQNAVQLRKLLAAHTMSYNSDSISNFSVLLDSSRPATDRAGATEELKLRESTTTEPEQKKGLKHDRSLDNLSDAFASPGSANNSKVLGSNEKEESKFSRPKDFRDLYESDSDASNDLADLCELNTFENIKKPANAAILIQENSSPEEEPVSPTRDSDPYRDLNLPKSGGVLPNTSGTGSDIIGSEDIGLEWEINLAPQKAPNTRNKPENNEKRSPENAPIIAIEENNAYYKESTSDPDKEKLADEIAEFIYATLIQETFTNPVPQRKIKPEVPLLKNVPQRDSIGAPNQSQQALMQSLAVSDHKGIRTDQGYIGNYVDELFVEVRKTQKEQFISEINKSIIKPPLEILVNLQSSEPERIMQTQLPHEVNPIVPLNTYLDLEKKREIKNKSEFDNTFLEECLHIHDKAVFDSVNEALNLIRPYGLNGEPMPWSVQGRILFKSIADPKIIIRNIRNMVQDWASFEVGTLPKREFLVNGKFDEDYFAEVREKQLATLLAQEVIHPSQSQQQVIDNEEMWINYEMEETEVGIDLADMALEQLVVEAIKAASNIEQTRLMPEDQFPIIKVTFSYTYNMIVYSINLQSGIN
eukprot:TRINITY_DN4500_c0_g1_i1.p1 TRINITY_DN4500_c0_g1~~TRINITY_DN4500_c0_g1_i1.p1  ORF type:complete len:1311 (-),score=211.19 TRINITY_DN4500_c0_g1_i1:1930-5862(-)